MESIIQVAENVGEILSTVGRFMPALLVLIPSVILMLLFVPILMVKGFKQGPVVPSVKCGATVLSFILAIFAGKGVGVLISGLCIKPLVSFVIGQIDSPEAESYLREIPYTEALLRSYLTCLLSVFFFCVFFILFLIVLRIVAKSIFGKFRSLADKNVGMRMIGMGVGLLDAILISVLIFMPTYTGINALSSTVCDAADEIDLTQFKDADAVDAFTTLKKGVDETPGAILRNPVIALAGVKGFDFAKSFYGNFTCNGKTGNMHYIADDAVRLTAAALPIVGKEPAEYGDYEIQFVKKLSKATEENEYVYCLVSDGVNICVKFVSNEENGEDTIIRKTLEPLSGFSVSDSKQLVSIVNSVAEKAIEAGVLKNTNDTAVLLSDLNDEEFLTAVVTNLREFRKLSKALDTALLAGIEQMKNDQAAENEKLAEGFDAVAQNIKKNIDDPEYNEKREIRSFSLILSGASGLYESTDGLKTFDFATVDTDALSDLFFGICVHPYVGSDSAEKLIRGLLPSMGDYGSEVFAASYLDDAVAALRDDIDHFNPEEKTYDGKFKNLISSTKTLVQVVDKMSTKDFDDVGDLEELVGDLLSGMSGDSAQIISEAVTSSLITQVGGENVDSEKISGVVSDLIMNIANADGSDVDAREKDSKAITALGSLMMTAPDTVNGLEDEEGKASIENAVNGTLSDFIVTVTESEVAMITVKNAISGGPDPTGSFAGLGESDKEAINNACNEARALGVSEEDITAILTFIGM